METEHALTPAHALRGSLHCEKYVANINHTACKSDTRVATPIFYNMGRRVAVPKTASVSYPDTVLTVLDWCRVSAQQKIPRLSSFGEPFGLSENQTLKDGTLTHPGCRYVRLSP